MNHLLKKAWKVINSCETHGQAAIALRYLELLGETHPELDLSPLKKELNTLFDLKK